MVRVAKIAAALILISCGGFLVYQGLSTYLGANSAQREAAAKWRTPRVNRRSNASLTRPKTIIPEGQVFSHLDVPRLNKSLYVVEGDNDSALEKGPGHLRGSAMPGEIGNCVIAGHRDLHFRFLKDVEPGDKVYLETEQGRFCYRVTGTKIISPTEVQVLQATQDAELHLITCYPFYFLGHAPKRFVVTAELELTPPRPDSPHTTLATVKVPSTIHPRRAPSNYQRSRQATRALNRAAAGDLQTSLVY